MARHDTKTKQQQRNNKDMIYSKTTAKEVSEFLVTIIPFEIVLKT